MQIIHKKYSSTKTMAFSGAKYKWHAEHIYKWVVAVKSCQSKSTKKLREESNNDLKEEESDALTQPMFADISVFEDIEKTKNIDANLSMTILIKERRRYHTLMAYQRLTSS